MKYIKQYVMQNVKQNQSVFWPKVIWPMIRLETCHEAHNYSIVTQFQSLISLIANRVMRVCSSTLKSMSGWPNEKLNFCIHETNAK